jgi:Tol biopolymer transport system component
MSSHPILELRAIPQTGEGPAFPSGISDDGDLVAVIGNGLTPDDQDIFSDLYVWDVETGVFTLVTRAIDGAYQGGDTSGAIFSPDGRYIAFGTDDVLDPADTVTRTEDEVTRSLPDLYLVDLVTGATRVLTVPVDPSRVSDQHFGLKFSPDGNALFFTTSSPLTPGDADTTADVYRHDIASGVTELLGPSPQVEKQFVFLAGISPYSAQSNTTPDGETVALLSDGRLTADDVDNHADVFLWRSDGSLALLTGASGFDGPSNFLGMTDDASKVLLRSTAQLAAGDTDGVADIVLYDTATGTRELIGATRPGGAEGEAQFGSISKDGRYVSYSTRAQVLAGDTDAFSDIYLLDRSTGETRLLTAAVSPAQEGDASGVLSPDGSGLLLNSFARLTADDTDNLLDTYYYDVGAGALRLIGGGLSGEVNFNYFSPTGDSAWLFSSAGGRFRWDRATDELTPVPVTGITNLSFSADGSAITFSNDSFDQSWWFGLGEGTTLPDCPVVLRPGTQSLDSAASASYVGVAGPETFFVSRDAETGNDTIGGFGATDVLAVQGGLYDSNRDGIVAFGNSSLRIDTTGADPDRVTFEAPGLKALRLLGEACEDIFVYADRATRPTGAKEGTLGDDALTGDAGNAVRDVFFYDTALELGWGTDTIKRFGTTDLLVTTTALGDSNGDGVIEFGADEALDLPGGFGEVAITGTDGRIVQRLVFEGVGTSGGVTYWQYSLSGAADVLF